MSIVDEIFIVSRDDIFSCYDKIQHGIIENKYGIGDVAKIEKYEYPNYIQVYGYDMYYSVELIDGKQRTNEKIVFIWLKKTEDNITIRVKIDSLKWKSGNRKITTNADMYWPMIVEKISRDLTGSADKKLMLSLYPKSTFNILRTEKHGLYLMILSFILLPFVLKYRKALFIVFTGLAVYTIYIILDLKKNNNAHKK